MDSFLPGASASVWDCRLIRRPAKAARRRPEPCLGRVTRKVFGRQKIALESTLPFSRAPAFCATTATTLPRTGLWLVSQGSFYDQAQCAARASGVRGELWT